MLDKVLIKKLYDNRFTTTELSERFGVSRQRISQIVFNYKSFGGHGHKKILKKISKLCSICGKPRYAIHHIDRNPYNNRPKNLLPLCDSCHKDVHRGEKRVTVITKGRWSTHFDKCERCGKTEHKHIRKGYCLNCFEYSKQNKCIICQKEITNRASRCRLHLEV